MAKTFICSDESINSYGFRVLTAGIDLTRFLKNPIGKFNHCDEWDDPNYSGPICKWSDVKKEGGQLIALPVFDIDDPKGKLIANKVDKGFLNAASIGFRIIETSEDPKLMLPGQKYATVTKCMLIEISVVDIPSNENACCLYDENDNRIELKDGSDLLKLSAFHKPSPNFIDMKKNITLKAAWITLLSWFNAKVDEGKESTEVELSDEKLTELNAKLAEHATLTADKKRLEGELSAEKSAKDVALAAQKKAEEDLAAANLKITELGGQPGQMGGTPTPPKNEGGGNNNKSLSIKAPEVGEEFSFNY